MPDGSTASSGDVAPAQSPVLVSGVTAGSRLRFSAEGVVDHGGTAAGPDGAGVFSHSSGAENGISNISAPIDALLGVFLDDTQPDLSPAPAALDFSTAASRDYLSLAPSLKQVFFIGDGETSLGDQQEIVVPTGATRLFLGTMDGFGWYNNTGAFRVTVVPEPASAALGTVLLLGVFGLYRKLSA